MSSPSTYLVVSLPTSISPANSHDEALTTLRSAVSTDYGMVFPINIPEFKVGTLDALVRQADELAKLEDACKGVVAKVGDALRAILEGDENKIAQQKTVNDKDPNQYLKTFGWNKVKYRADKPLSELIDTLQKEMTSIDNDVKAKYNSYNQVKTTLTNLQKKQTGNLSTKSLTSVVPSNLLITDSEYLQTHLIAVPVSSTKDFFRSYETLCSWIVPRSANYIAQDDEYALYSVTTFKKSGQEFIHKVREQKWIPRDFKSKEGGADEEKKEADKVSRQERQLWGEALRLGHTGWGEAVQGWMHVLVLRAFVETVLRYGLPLSFICGIIKTTPKLSKRARTSMDAKFSYLGGNAFGRDRKGRVTKDDSAMSADMQAAGHTGDGGDYSPYVCYQFEIV